MVFKDILKSLIYILFISLILFIVKTFFTFKMFSIFMIVLISFIGVVIIILQINLNYKYKKYYEYFKDNKIRVKDMMGLSNFNLVNTIFASESIFLSHIKFDKALNFNGREDSDVFLDFLQNSFYKNSIKNKVDLAVSKYIPDSGYNYEFISSKPSVDGTSSLVLLRNKKQKDYKMINIGDVDSIISLCNKVKISNTTKKIDKVMINSIYDKVNSYVNKGYLVYLVASKNTKNEIKIDDNNNMTFIGFVLFRRSFKKNLMNEFKMLNDKYNVKLFSDTISSDKMLHNGIVKMNDVKLLELISSNDVFYKFDYLEKRRVIELSKSKGKVMYVTNDIDDILALKCASISVTSSKDAILREISDVILKDSSSIIDFIDTSTYLSKLLENQE